MKNAIIPPDHRPSESRRPQRPLIHRHRPRIRDDPNLLRDPGRQDRAIHDSEYQDQPQHCHAAEHGKPRPPHLDAAPPGIAVYGREDADIRQLERDREPRAGDRGFQPRHLLGSRDQDAAHALGEGLQDGPDVAVAVEHGNAEGLEDGTAPGYGGSGLFGGVYCVVEAEELEGEDGDEEKGRYESDIEGFGGEEGRVFRDAGGSSRCSRVYSARCNTDEFVSIAAFAGFLVVENRFFGWCRSSGHDGVPQPSGQFVVLGDEK